MISIFIRTYRNDLKWFEYCIEGIKKNLSGWGEIVVCVPVGQNHYFKKHEKEFKFVNSKIYKDDYIGQQISKLEAWKHCNGDYILYVDSDVIFFKGAKVEDYFLNNKPVILKHRYELVGEAKVWQPVVEKLFQDKVEYEYMRRAPQLFHKSTVKRFSEAFPDIENYGKSQPYRQFTEFNFLGYFTETTEPENYEFIDLEFNEAPENKCKQFWSWSGLTRDEKREIQSLLE
jgi:glycosyltransferase involved in cell wall biosynthesis